ncbi:MAG TPA: 30S ribosomal protein S4 [Candidatus Pacearchaeota archaeon]|nr:30S ribosomal protein S4P [archaeon BMS3Abin17]HDK42759.1 30S ribosomal protein S4 [Candidatus Pacearchaeota archaeon]HDZ60124.1 30S ribosomal protein S4 [Candidatus Pacearchaeota archaeon]
MKRKHKQYSKPKRPFDKARIDEEAEIKKEFGLKNKKEIWRAEAKIKSMREKAKKLISADPKEQEALFERLRKIGLNVNSIADVLSLDKTDYLKRRLQTVLMNKRLATTPKNARQLITHRKVLVDGKVVDSPSYVVPVTLESKITLKLKKKKQVKKAPEGVPSEEGKEPKSEEKQEEVKEREK